MIDQNDIEESIEVLLTLKANDIPLLGGSVEHVMDYAGNYSTDEAAEEGKTYLENLLDRLGDYTQMSALTDALGNITDAITSLLCVCTNLQQQSQSIIAQSTIIQLENNPDVTQDAVVVEDFSEESGEKCQRAQAAVDMALQFARNVVNYAVGTGAISAPVLVGLVSVLVPVAIPVEIIVVFMMSIAVMVFGSGLDILLDLAEANKRDFVCALYNAATPLEAYQNACEAIDALNLNVVGTLLKLFFTERPLSFFYANSSPEGYGTSCVDCEQGEGCVDFTDGDWWRSLDYTEITEEGYLHITGSGVGLPELAARVFQAQGSAFDLKFKGRGSLHESHYWTVIYFTAHDASHNVVDTDQYYELRTDDDWFTWEGSVSGQNIDHVHVSIRGVTSTQGWIQYMCVSEQ